MRKLLQFRIVTGFKPYVFQSAAFIIFFIQSLQAIAVAPVADFTASPISVCVGQAITFTNASTGSITSYSWNFGSGATPATISGIGPHSVTYSTTGTKTISLTVTGPGGSNTMTKSNYVVVGADRIKIMSYNLLNYDSTDNFNRNQYFRTVLNAMDPDILVVEEMVSNSGMNGFLANVLNYTTTTYSKGTFLNGPDSDNGIFYKTSKFNFVSNTSIETDLRDINEFKLVHVLSGETIRLYALHLKANEGQPYEDQRALEIDSLRKVTNALPVGSNFIVTGDFNFYRSGEPAYQKLLDTNGPNEGYFQDAITMTGDWGVSQYAQYHTQSPRLGNLGDGGTTGGLDDRFDLMLYSHAISVNGGITLVQGSIFAIGNDGNHYNQSVNNGTNTAVSAAVADALYSASDHLPIIGSFDFQTSNCQTFDIGATALLSPASSTCPGPQKTLQVRIKNHGTNTVDFSTNHADVNLTVTKPNSTNENFSKTILTGTLAPGATMDITYASTCDMSAQGTYTFNASTSYAPDGNPTNNAMASTDVTVTQNSNATVTPSGSTTFCTGGSVTLTAMNGSNYLWSTGATTQAITVSSAGNYSVSMTDQTGCIATSTPTTVTVNTYQSNYTVFTETMGNLSGTTSTTMLNHENNNGFDNDNYTMSGTADVRTTVFNGNTSNSGGANIFITNTVDRNFIISGISTTGLNNLQLSFGVQKSSITFNGLDLSVLVSSDGTNYTPLTFSALPTGSGTTIWYYVTASGTIPSVPNLRIQFKQTATNTQFRIDDVSLISTNSNPVITAQGPTTFCQGGSVNLMAVLSSAYNWSTGATTQTINVNSSGSYYSVLTSANGCTASSNTINVTVDPNTPPVITPQGPTSFCPGGSVVLSSNSANAYLWSTGATTQNITVSSTGNYTVRTTNANGCTATSAATHVTVYPNPPPVITPQSPTTFCAGGSVILSSTAASSYIWSNALSTQNISVTTSGSFTVTTTSVNGCTATSTPVTVTVDPNVQPVITPQGPIELCTGGSVVLTSSSANSYAWSTNATTQSINVSTPGSYTVTTTTANSCTNTSDPVVVTLSSCQLTVNIKAFIQGFYEGNETMKAVADPVNHPTVCDTVTLLLATSNGAHSISYTSTSILNTDGSAHFIFPSAAGNTNYFLVFRHRNILATWSSTAVMITDNIFYDFTDASTKAYGGNMADLNDGFFGMISGDVDQNDLVDITDFTLMISALENFESGYIPSDLNGDWSTESTDFSLMENNLTKSVMRP